MRVHSRVKLVTNSSSETYMFVKDDEMGVEKLHEFITAVLAAGGSTKTSEELFKIELVKIPSYLDDRIEYLKEEGEEPEQYDMCGDYPDGIHTLEVTPLDGVEVDVDLTNLITNVFQAEDIGNEW